ncbi:MAG: SDR family oxidoreductase [Candidatus Vogelbacteria bacterium]
MKVLVIGGTTGFGKEVSEKLKTKNFEVMTVGRSDNADFPCDVGDLEKWQKVLSQIVEKHPAFDLVIFAVGFARAKSSKDLTLEDWQEHINKNFLYVAIGLQVLKGNLDGVVGSKVVTIGSQWSYKIGNDELVPYTIAKHAVNALTKDFAMRDSLIKANHYCVPTMDTPQYSEVMESFDNVGKEFMVKELANPKAIAEILVDHCLEYSETGKTLVINGTGVREI